MKQARRRSSLAPPVPAGRRAGRKGSDMQVRGSVDVVTSAEIRGWAYAPGQRTPVAVQAVLHHEILGEAVADALRPDLAAAGLGDGRCGYTIRLYRQIDPLYLPFLAVKLDGGDAELPRANASGFGEYFTALHRAHPATGRTRSVLGGLWTDRVDAPALLRGKLNVGQVAEEATAPLTRLIHEGIAILDLRGAPAPGFWNGTMAERVGAILEDGALLSVLRAVLEDHPLIVRSETMAADATDLTQPSSDNPSPSPAECVAVVVPLGDGVVIELVRDSHKLPEFTPAGHSRWAKGAAPAALEMAAQHGTIDQVPLELGSFAVVGAGALYRLRRGVDSDALQMLCLPARLMPVGLVTDESREAVAYRNGARALIALIN